MIKIVKITKPIRIFPRLDKGKLTGSITIDDEEIKTRVVSIEVIRRCTVGTASAKIILANIDQQYSDKWSGGETIIIKADFVSGTTRIFEGHITNIKESFDRAPQLEINCNDYGIQSFNNPVYKKYDTATDIGTIADEIISEYLTTHTRGNINTSTGVTATPTWQGKDLWMCLKDLAVKYGNNNYDFYCDYDKDWHFFQKGTLEHGIASKLAIVFGQNHRRTSLENPFLDKRNKITVIGATIDGVPLIATKKDQTDINTYWEMTEIIKDTNLITQTQVNNMATLQLANKTDVGRSGKVLADGLPGLLPGYKVMIFDPNNNMNGFFVISEIIHRINPNFTTEVAVHEQISKEETMIDFMNTIIDSKQETLELDNEYGMENTYTFTFDDDTDLTHTGTETKNSKLMLQPGNTTGTVITDMTTANEDITYVVMKVNGTDIDASEFFVSINNGLSYEAVPVNERHTLDVTGKHLKVKIILNTSTTAANPQIDSMSVMYK